MRFLRNWLTDFAFRPEALAHEATATSKFFETDEENEAVLREVRRVLAPGGRFGMKVVNGACGPQNVPGSLAGSGMISGHAALARRQNPHERVARCW